MNIKKILLYMILTGIFAVPFIPFLVPSMMYFPFIAGKGFAFRIVVEIVFGLFVALAFMDKSYRPKTSWILKSVIFFTGAVLLSDLLSVNVYKSIWSNYERMEGFVLIAHLLLYFIVLSSVMNFSRWKAFWNTTIGASLIMSFYGVFQLLGKVQINQGGVRLDGTLGNATYLAIYLVFHVFLCLYMLVRENTPKWQRWVYGMVALFEVFILYFTATRGAILGLLGGLLFFGLIILWKERGNAKLRKASFGVLGAIIILLALFIVFRQSNFVKNSPVLSRFSTLSIAEFKTQGRYFVWPMAWKGFLEKPILGWGQESFNFVFNKYYDPGLYGQEQWFDRTHNIFLDWLIAGGLIGLLAYLSMYFALFYYLWKDKKFSLPEKAVFSGMIVAYIFHNIFVFDNLISYIMFFSVLAFIHSINVEGKESHSSFGTKTFSRSVSDYVVLPGAVLLTVFAVYIVNVPAIQANETLIQAMNPQQEGLQKNLDLFKQAYSYKSFGSTEVTEQLVQSAIQLNSANGDPAIKNQFAQLAKEKIEEKIIQAPTDARYLVFAGSFFNRFGLYDDAIKYLERALIESPKKQTIFFELGSAYIGKGDYQKVLALFKEAYNLEPSSKESQILYTIAALYAKDDTVIKEMSQKLDVQTIVSDDRFLRAYASLGDYQSALNILAVRLEKDPKNSQNRLYLASIYLSMGQKQKAVGVIQDMIKDDPSFKTQGEQYIQQINSR